MGSMGSLAGKIRGEVGLGGMEGWQAGGQAGNYCGCDRTYIGADI